MNRQPPPRPPPRPLPPMPDPAEAKHLALAAINKARESSKRGLTR